MASGTVVDVDVVVLSAVVPGVVSAGDVVVDAPAAVVEPPDVLLLLHAEKRKPSDVSAAAIFFMPESYGWWP